MKVEDYALVDFKRENGFYYPHIAVKTQGLLFSHYYLLTLETNDPMISVEDIFEAIDEEKINICRIRRKGKEMSLGHLYFSKYTRNDMRFYGTEYKWDECTTTALTVQSGYIEQHLRSPI